MEKEKNLKINKLNKMINTNLVDSSTFLKEEVCDIIKVLIEYYEQKIFNYYFGKLKYLDYEPNTGLMVEKTYYIEYLSEKELKLPVFNSLEELENIVYAHRYAGSVVLLKSSSDNLYLSDEELTLASIDESDMIVKLIDDPYYEYINEFLYTLVNFKTSNNLKNLSVDQIMKLMHHYIVSKEDFILEYGHFKNNNIVK